MCRLQCDALHILSANRVCVAARRSGVQAGVGLRRGDDPPRQHAQEDRLVESSCDASLGQRWPAKGRREHHLLSRGAQRKKSKYRVCTVRVRSLSLRFSTRWIGAVISAQNIITHPHPRVQRQSRPSAFAGDQSKTTTLGRPGDRGVTAFRAASIHTLVHSYLHTLYLPGVPTKLCMGRLILQSYYSIL